MATQVGTTGKSYVYNQITDRHLVRTASGVMYVVLMNYTDHKIEIWKSTDNGGYFTLVSGTVACALYSSCSVAIDGGSPQLLRIVYHSDITTVKYNTFNTSSDTWGTAETVATIVSPAGAGFSVGIALDSANYPHVVFHEKINIGGTDYTKTRYRNKVGGVTWQTIVTIEASANEAKNTTGAPFISIDTTTGHNRKDLPQIFYATSPDNLIQAALGDFNNATAFTVVQPGTKLGQVISAAIDPTGRTNLVFYYNGSGVYTAILDLPDATAWNGSWNYEGNSITGDNAASSGGLFISGTTRYLVTQNAALGVRYQVSLNYGAWSVAAILSDVATYTAIVARGQYANDPKSSFDVIYRNSSNLYFFGLVQLTIPNTSNFMLFF